MTVILVTMKTPLNSLKSLTLTKEFVLVQRATKKTKQYYVAKIETVHNDDNTVDVIFLKRIHSETDNRLRKSCRNFLSNWFHTQI